MRRTSPTSPPLSATLVLLVLGTGCIENQIHGQGFGSGGEQNEPAEDSGYSESGVLPFSEPCSDEDPLADDVGVIEDCAHDVVQGELDAVVEWSMEDLGDYTEFSHVLMAPVVGQLSDDDGDGDIDADDTPDIVVLTDDDGDIGNTGGVLRILSGDGAGYIHAGVYGAELDGRQAYPYRFANVALGDIDLDGLPEIVTVVSIIEDFETGGDTGGGGLDTGGEDDPPTDSGEPEDTGDNSSPVRPAPPDEDAASTGTCGLAAYDHELQLEWITGTEVGLPCGGHAPLLADLDGDGEIEIVVGNVAVKGRSGALHALGGAGTGRFEAFPEVGMHAAVADLDGDGANEWIAGGTIYDGLGNTVCDTGTGDGFVAIADLDMDGRGEVTVVSDGTVAIFEADCTLRAAWPIQGDGNGGPPTISDFDGDGEPEIGIAGASYYGVYEAVGTLLWANSIQDISSHVTGSLVYDFEGDGRPEIVFADETALWVYDGATGEVRLRDEGHTSRTLHEYPTVADVDGDLEVEIIVPNGGNHYGDEKVGLYVLGSESHGWMPGRQVWNQHAYSITNVDDDLGLPSPAVSNWPDHNNFRSGDPAPAAVGDVASDAVPLADVCLDECDQGIIVLHVKIGNQGLAGLRRGAPISIYTEIEGERFLVKVVETLQVAQPGETSDLVRIELDPAEVDSGVIIVVVDDFIGTSFVNECDEENNELRIEDAACP